ncbi:hypothetical protein ACTFIR_004424 [Dictyostelium discoideum]
MVLKYLAWSVSLGVLLLKLTLKFLKISEYLFKGSINSLVYATIPTTDQNIKLFFNDLGSLKIGRISTGTKSSIYIIGDTKLHIENYLLDFIGKTSNKEYDDTKLIFSSDNPNNVTDIIIGENQRFRNSLYIEFSNSVTIKNSVIIGNTGSSRSPLVFFQSNVNISGNLIVGTAGSSMIAQYGTEYIESSNNYFSLVLPNEFPTSPAFMDYGQENVTGFDKDCFAPCDSNSIVVPSLSQVPIDFSKNLVNPISINPVDYFLIVNSDEELKNTFFTIKDSLLDIYDSFFGSSTSPSLGDNGIKSSAVIIKNSSFYIDGFQLQNNQIYGSSVVPYLYKPLNVDEFILVDSIFPTSQYQIPVGGKLDLVVKLVITSPVISHITCELESDNETITSSAISESVHKECKFPLTFKNDGPVNLKVTVKLKNVGDSEIMYIINFPNITIFITITTRIDSETKYYQIQLFFTHQPIDDQPTPLSIYIEYPTLHAMAV